MLSPLPRRSGWAYCFAHSPIRVSLPRYGRRVGLRLVLFEAYSAFTRVTACTLALSPIRDTLTEGFSHFVTSMTAPVASGWSDLPGGPCIPLESAAFSRRTPDSDSRIAKTGGQRLCRDKGDADLGARRAWRLGALGYGIFLGSRAPIAPPGGDRRWAPPSTPPG